MANILRKTTAALVEEGKKRAASSGERTRISVMTDNVRSLDNVGMIFRLGELVKVEQVYLGGYTGYPRIEGDDRPQALIDSHQRRIEKTAVYALDLQPWSYLPDPVPRARELKEAGYQLVALEQTDLSQSFNRVEYKLPLLLIVGHEREGIRDELLELADLVIEIPILGQGNSHNVATATGIVLYEVLEKTGRI